MNTSAFWHTTALLALSLQGESPFRRLWNDTRHPAAWWAAPVEAANTFQIFRAEGSSEEAVAALGGRFEEIYAQCEEILPTKPLRDHAVSLMGHFDLTFNEAFHLAAALTWCGDKPEGRILVSLESALTDTAKALGFQVVTERTLHW
jgi:hypothetical protein